MAYVAIYDSRRWVRSDSTDTTIVLPVVAGGTGSTSSTGNGAVVLANGPTLIAPNVGAGGTGTTTSTLVINSGSGAGAFAFLIFERNAAEKAGIAVAAGPGQFTPAAVANDFIIRSAQKIIFSADGGITDHVSIGPTGVLAMLNAPMLLKAYTVATLPAGVLGYHTIVTDALGPAYGAAVVGGGAVVTPVYYNGAAWIVG